MPLDVPSLRAAFFLPPLHAGLRPTACVSQHLAQKLPCRITWLLLLSIPPAGALSEHRVLPSWSGSKSNQEFQIWVSSLGWEVLLQRLRSRQRVVVALTTSEDNVNQKEFWIQNQDFVWNFIYFSEIMNTLKAKMETEILIWWKTQVVSGKYLLWLACETQSFSKLWKRERKNEFLNCSKMYDFHHIWSFPALSFTSQLQCKN